MYHNKRTSDIKRAQKSSLLQKIISDLFLQASLDDQMLQGLSVTRVQLSPDKSVCEVFFMTQEGASEQFDQKLSRLILYKPSLRAALAKQIAGRYTPNLVFKYDIQEEKAQKIDVLLMKLKEKGEL